MSGSQQSPYRVITVRGGAGGPGAARGVLDVLMAALLVWAGGAIGLAGGAGAQDAGSAALSWSASERVTNLTRLDAPETAVYLTVDTAQPIDSLGFQLRWAARQPDAWMAVLGLRGLAEPSNAPWQMVPKNGQMAFRTFRALDEWLSEPGYLASIREDGPAGGGRYRLAIALAVENLVAARIEASGVTVRFADGTRRQLGSPAVSVGTGWTIEHPPLVSEVTGVVNQRFLQSNIRITGVDLDRLSEIMLVDAAGGRFHPVRFQSWSTEAIEVCFPNRVVATGLARLVYRDPNCVTDSLNNAIEVAVLEERQPGDTNLGVVPGRE